ncbi:MAG: FprA family A-type flavoprotein [Planctomycetota bacterium]
METIPINDKVAWVGVNDRDTALFEKIWPLPRGVSYNSYLIRDRKTALIDTVKKFYLPAYLDKLAALLGDVRKLDYLVVNHMEPDHSGSVKVLHDLCPDLRIVGNKKTAAYLKDLYGICDRVLTIADGGELDLGGRKLSFFFIPMVHWPESMVTYDAADRILFSNDAFGGFGTLDGGLFDDEVDIEHFEDEILRYFSNIVGRYAPMVQKAIARLKGLDIRVIAPSHGPVWRHDPGKIVQMYDKWSRYEAEPGVVIAYASMYGNTETMMEAVARGLALERCSTVRIHDLSTSHISYVIRDAWKYRALVLGSPTHDTQLFPPMDLLVRILANKKLGKRIVGVFGTRGWTGGAVAALTQFAKNDGLELVEPIVEATLSPKGCDLENCVLLGRNIAKRLRTDPPG